MKKYLNNLAILHGYDSAEITCFKFETLIALNVKTSRQKADKRSFVKSILPPEWLKEANGMLPSKSSSLYKLGHHIKIVEIQKRVKNGESPADFLQEFDDDRNGDKKSLKTYRNMGKIVGNFVNCLEELSHLHGVHLSEINIIYRIITDAMGFQWTTEKLEDGELVEFQQDLFMKRVIAYFNDNRNRQDEIIDANSLFETDFDILKMNKYFKQIIKMIYSMDLSKIMDHDNLVKNADRLLYHCDLYLPKKLSEEENKEKFLCLYQVVYNYLVEAIWIFIMSNMIDYWIVSRIRQDKLVEELNTWSRFSQEIEDVKSAKNVQDLRNYVGRKYFWLKIFSDDIFKKYSKGKMPRKALLNSLVMEFSEGFCCSDDVSSAEEDHENESDNDLREGYENESDNDLREVYEKESCEILPVEEEYAEEEYAEEYSEKRDEEEEYYSAKAYAGEDQARDDDDDLNREEYAGEEGDYNSNFLYREAKTIGSQDIELEKDLNFEKGLKQYFDKYIFDKYVLSGDPSNVIKYTNNYIGLSTRQYSFVKTNRLYKKRFNLSVGTATRMVKEHNETVEDCSKKITYISNFQMTEIDELKRVNDDRMKHKKPGFYNRSEIARLLVKKPPFNSVSEKTIMRRLISLEEENKIPRSESFEKYRGKYYKEEHLVEIERTLLAEFS